MAESYKRLGSLAPADTQEKVLYTSPASTSTLVTNITVANRTSSDQTFDVNVYNSVKTNTDFAQVQVDKIASVESGNAISSTDGITWTSTAVGSGNWFTLATGNSLFYTINVNTTNALSSTDGITWTVRTLSQSGNWQALAGGNNTWAAISYNTTDTIYSTNGITWQSGNGISQSNRNFSSMAYGNGVFVATSESGHTTAARSTNGITWTMESIAESKTYMKVAFGNGRFVAVALNSTAAASSTNGITWSVGTLPSSQGWRVVACKDTTFVSLAINTTQAASSTNGITWTTRTLPINTNWLTLAAGNSIFFATGSGNSAAASSTDGITWTLRTLPNTNSRYNVGILPITQNYSSPAVNNIYKDATVSANSIRVLEPGITLGQNNTVVAKGTSNTTISVYGMEIS
jgi:hypothetical protein